MATIRPVKFPVVSPGVASRPTTEQPKNHGPNATKIEKAQSGAVLHQSVKNTAIRERVDSSEPKATKFYHPKDSRRKEPAKLGQVIDIKV